MTKERRGDEVKSRGKRLISLRGFVVPIPPFIISLSSHCFMLKVILVLLFGLWKQNSTLSLVVLTLYVIAELPYL